MALLLTSAAGAADGPVDVSYNYITGNYTLQFPGDPYSFTYDAAKTFPGNMGLSEVATDDGDTLLVPNYVMNLRSALNAARAWLADKGLGVDSPPSNVKVHTTDSYSGAYGGFYPFLSLYFADDLAITRLLTTAVHEWFHVVQDDHWNTFGYTIVMGRFQHAFSAAVEGTAEWASDLPIPIDVRGVTVSGLRGPNGIRGAAVTGLNNSGRVPRLTANQINEYFSDSYLTWASSDRQARSVFGYSLSGDAKAWSAYGTVFFWKCVTRRTGRGEHDVAAMKAFWDGFHARNVHGHSQLIEEVAERTRHSGRRGERFARFFEDYMADCIALVNTTGQTGFTDDAFQTPGGLNCVPAMQLERHYSKQPEAIPGSVAAGESEIQQRLAGIAAAVDGVETWGFKAVAIDPFAIGGFGDSPQRVVGLDDATHLFLLARGRAGAWGAVALTHYGEDATRRGVDVKAYRDAGPVSIRMDRINFSLTEPNARVGGQPAAYFHMRNFNTKNRAERVFVGLANMDESGAATSAEVAFAVTPHFGRLFDPAKKKPEGQFSPTGTVKFLSSQPARDWPNESFQPGDTVTVRVNVSDEVHLGDDTDIPAERRTLSAEVLGPGGQAVAVEGERFDCVPLDDRSLFTLQQSLDGYTYRFTIPESLGREGPHTLRLRLSSLLRLGNEDRDEDDSFRFTVSRARPVVARVVVRRDAEEGAAFPTVFYDSQYSNFKPITPGAADVRITFDRDMNREKPAEVKLGERALTGRWDDARTFIAALSPPAGEAYAQWKGVHALSITAESAEGKQLDAEPETDGEQPDTTHRVVVDALPPIVETVDVHTGAGKRYAAEWEGGPDFGRINSYRDKDIEQARRELDIPTSEHFSEDDLSASIYLHTSQPLAAAPKVTLGGMDVPMKQGGHDKVWSGEFRADKLRESLGEDTFKPVPVVIEAVDVYGNALDAHPATVARLKLPDPGSNANWWLGYESQFAGANTGKGGPDESHRLNAYGPGDVWVDHNEKLDTARMFTMVRRGDGVQLRFGDNDIFEGRISGNRLSAYQRTRTVQELVDSKWYVNYKLVATPPRKTLEQVMARYGPSGQVGHGYDMTLKSETEWKGNAFGISIRYDDDGKLTRFWPKGDPWPHTFTPYKERPESQPESQPENQPPPRPFKPLKLTEKWVAYRMTHRAAGRLHMIDVKMVRYRRYGDERAWLEVFSYPVAYMRNEQTGRTAFNIQWSSSDVEVFEKAEGLGEIEPLAARAGRLREGSFPRAEANRRVQQILGPDSYPLR